MNGSLGRHIIAEYYGCSAEYLADPTFMDEAMNAAAQAAHATIIDSTFHHFSPYGVSGVVVIQESHLSVHTWPEYGFASVDVYTCGNEIDPWVSCAYLKKAFQANHYSAIEMKRGQKHLLPDPVFPTPDLAPQQVSRNRSIWFTERTENLALSVRHNGSLIFRRQSPFQKIEVFHSEAFGNIMVLDGVIATTEKDEFVYHEMLAHVPLLSHAAPKEVLIVGGGDGGVLREVLRHAEVEKVTMLEIDQEVVETSKRFFPHLSTGFQDPRVNLLFDDGLQFLKKHPSQHFDLILLDTADAIEVGKEAEMPQLFTAAHQHLQPAGILAMQAGSPAISKQAFKRVFQTLYPLFGRSNTHAFLTHIPTFPSGMWGFALATKTHQHPLDSLQAHRQTLLEKSNPLRYYNAAIHQAAFALPNFVREMVGE